jgi:photosystem II stability/assembly factor-like uncharacterized protein
MDRRTRNRIFRSRLFLFLFAITFPVFAAAQQRLQPAFPSGPKVRPPAAAARRADIVRRRTEWFYRQRAYPYSTIPAGARSSAVREMDSTLRNQEAPAGPAAAASSTRWTLVGPNPTNNTANSYENWGVSSGRVTALTVDPGNSNVVYLGAAEGGIWKTTDAGDTWSPLTDTQASLAIGSVAIDPTNSSIIYAGTGETNVGGYYGAGILKSTNGGSTWTQVGASTFEGPFPGGWGGAEIGALAVDPSNNQILLAGTRMPPPLNGIYRSTDGGTSWTGVLSGADGTSVLFDPTNGNIAYAALGSYGGSVSNGIYKSINAGLTWSLLAGVDSGVIVLAIAPTNTSTLYAAVATTSGDFHGLFKTTDGANWGPLPFTTDYCNGQCNYDMAIAVSPVDANVVVVGQSANYNAAPENGMVFASKDGGMTWSDITIAGGRNLHPDQHALAFSGDGLKLFVGNDGGISSTPFTGTVNWTNLNATLAITQVYPGISIDPANLNNSFAGTQDNGTQQYSGSLAWTALNVFGDGGWTAIDSTSLYAAGQGSPSGYLVAKCPLNNLFVCSESDSGIDANDNQIFIAPLVMDPSNNQTLYYGTNRVYQTTNGAGSWTALPNSDLTGCPSLCALTTIVVAPNNPNTVYAGTDNAKVLVTTNAGSGAASTWEDHSSGLPPRYLTQVAVDPGNSQIAYVTFSGWSGFDDTVGHIFKTTNGGTNWTDISGTLPNIPVNDVVIDPDILNTLYIATDIGVFSTSNGGSTWAPLMTGLPRVVVTGLKLHRSTRTLRASTYGRSVWDLLVPAKKRRGQITSQ